MLPLDAGSLMRDGRPMTDRARASTLFYLPDSIVPWPAQSVRWAIDFTLGFFNGRAHLRDEVVQRLDIGPLLDATIGSLSKGQRKRALLAIGLLMPQPLLLADEPFDGLDLRQSRDVAQTLRSYASAGRTMFLSIHQIKDAARVCDRFVLLSGGTIRGEGTFDELAVAGRVARRRAAAISKRCSLPSREEGTRAAENAEKTFLCDLCALCGFFFSLAGREGIPRARGVARVVGAAAGDGAARRRHLHQRGADLRRSERPERHHRRRRRSVLAADRHLGADLQRLRGRGGVPAAVRRDPAGRPAIARAAR